MSKLIKKYVLSEIYTNLTIWVTGTSILFKNNFIDSQVMFVTGPKSFLCIIEFLNIKNTDEYDYLKHCQHRTTILQSPDQPLLPTPPTRNDVSILSSNNASGGYNLHDVNIDGLSDKSRMVSTNKKTVNVEVQKRKTNWTLFSKSIFQNCSITTVNIIYKS